MPTINNSDSEKKRAISSAKKWKKQQIILTEQAKKQGKVIYWTQVDDTVDRIAWKVCGQTEGVTELIFEENYGLVDLGVFLPENIPVIIPNISNVENASGQVILWQ